MVCSVCGQSGHNKTTCGRSGKTKKKSPVRVKKTSPTTKKREKVSFENVPSMTSQEAETKLKSLREGREEQYKIANKCVESLTSELDDGTVGKNCSVKAEEKTGKRVIMEFIHLITIINHFCGVLTSKSSPKSVYVTALNRKDTKDQFREQQDDFGILSIVATCVAELIGDIIKLLCDPSHDGVIYIHLDECDFGSGDGQSLSKLWKAEELNLPKNKSRIKYITYSATPEELEYSTTGKSLLWDHHTFTPTKDYIGAQWYLDNDLVFRPEVFFNGVSEFSKQGIKLIKEVNENCSSPSKDMSERMRNVIVVRDTGKGHLNLIRINKENLEEKYSCNIYVFDQSNGFDWGDKKQWATLGRSEILDEDEIHVGYKWKTTVIFISQICTRSTELCPLGHRKIAIWHDSRMLEDKKAYNTISQAIGRVKHYTQHGKKPNRIKLYCDIKVLKRTVGLLDDDEDIKLSARVLTNKGKKKKVKFDSYEDKGEVVWSDGDPNEVLRDQPGLPKFWKHENGKYHIGEKGYPRLLNDRPPWNDWIGRQSCLEYESKESDWWSFRKAIYVKDTNPEDRTVDFKTKKTSMYS